MKNLIGGVQPVAAAPDPDEEVHRDEQQLPEAVEQEEVEREEHAQHAGLEREQQRVEAALLLVDLVASCPRPAAASGRWRAGP